MIDVFGLYTEKDTLRCYLYLCSYPTVPLQATASTLGPSEPCGLQELTRSVAGFELLECNHQSARLRRPSRVILGLSYTTLVQDSRGWSSQSRHP
jgi:hypothetical protein